MLNVYTVFLYMCSTYLCSNSSLYFLIQQQCSIQLLMFTLHCTLGDTDLTLDTSYKHPEIVIKSYQCCNNVWPMYNQCMLHWLYMGLQHWWHRTNILILSLNHINVRPMSPNVQFNVNIGNFLLHCYWIKKNQK